MLKEKVSKMLVLMNESATRPLEEANLIDSIQRLGLYHHFEHEIGEVLQHIHNSYVENGAITLNEDLHCVALVFRLLRQQGYHILPGRPHPIYPRSIKFQYLYTKYFIFIFIFKRLYFRRATT